MISYLFFPKKIKEKIAELQSIDDLNDAAVSSLRNIFLINIGIMLMILSLFYFTSLSFMYVFLILIIIVMPAGKFIVYKYSESHFLPYFSKNRKILTMVKFYFNPYRGTKIVFKDENEKIYNSYLLSGFPKNGKKEIENNNNKILCYIYGENENRCLPDIAVWRHKHCLSKSELKGDAE